MSDTNEGEVSRGEPNSSGGRSTDGVSLVEGPADQGVANLIRAFWDLAGKPREFRERMLTISGAHACVIKYAHKPDEASLLRDFASRLEKQSLRRWVEAVDKRRAIRLPTRVLKDCSPPPSGLCLNKSWEDLFAVAKPLFVAIGATSRWCKEHDSEAVSVEWPAHLALSPAVLSGKIEQIVLPGRKTTDSCSTEPTIPELRPRVFGPGLNEITKESIRSVGDYFLTSDDAGEAISVLAIPVPHKTQPWSPPSRYFTVELYWFGEPVNVAEDELRACFMLSHLIVPTLTLEPTPGEFHELILTLARTVKAPQTGVHSTADWIRRSKGLLGEFHPLFRNLPETMYKAMSHPAFYRGLEVIQEFGAYGRPLKRPLRLASIYTRTAIYLTFKELTSGQFSIDLPVQPKHFQYASEVDACDVNVTSWHKFFDMFNSHDGDDIELMPSQLYVISGISLGANYVRCHFNSKNDSFAPDPKGLKLFRDTVARAVRNSRPPERRQGVFFFYEALIEPNHAEIDTSGSHKNVVRIVLKSRTGTGEALLTLTNEFIEIKTTTKQHESEYGYLGDGSVLVLDSTLERGNALEAQLTEHGTKPVLTGPSALKESRELPQTLFAHHSDLVSLATEDERFFVQWLQHNPVILAYTGTSTLTKDSVRAEIRDIPLSISRRTVACDIPVGSAGMATQEMERILPVLRSLAKQDDLSDKYLEAAPDFAATSAVLIHLSTNRRPFQAIEETATESKTWESLVAVLNFQEPDGLTTSPKNQSKRCIDLNKELEVFGDDAMRAIKRISSLIRSGRSDPKFLADFLRSISENLSTGNPHCLNFADESIGCLSSTLIYPYLTSPFLLHQISAGLTRNGLNVTWCNVNTQVDLAEPDDLTFIVWGSHMSETAEIELLEALSVRDCARRMAILPISFRRSLVLRYLEGCGASIIDALDFDDRIARVPKEFRMKPFGPEDPLGLHFRDLIRHSRDKKRVAAKLKSVAPWMIDFDW